MSWLTVESDPAVFSTLIADLGVKDVQVEELFSIDAAALNALIPNYGVVFLFKYQGNDDGGDKTDKSFKEEVGQDDVWFAHQIIQNACGTQALLAILLNQPDIKLGPALSDFKNFTGQFPPDLRGEAMTNSELLRTVHNSFSRSEMFHQDNDDDLARRDEAEAPYHFISYSNINGNLYELDGLKPAPINHGDCQGDFGGKLQKVLETRIARYPANEIHFNLLGLTRDPMADGGPQLTEYERHQELEKKEIRRKEIEMRRHGFAGAIVEIAKILLKSKSPTEVEQIIKKGKESTNNKRQQTKAAFKE